MVKGNGALTHAATQVNLEAKKAVRKGHLYKMSGVGKFIETKYVVVA